MITIRILDVSTQFANVFGVNQVVYLDTDTEFGMRLSKTIEQLTEADEIAQSASASNSLPYTPRNLSILESYQSNVFNRKKIAIPVEVKADGVTLPIDKLRVLGFQDREKKIEVELYGTGWVTDLQETPLNSVDLGVFTYGFEEVVVDAWGDPKRLVYPALSHWGGWNTPGDVTRKDLRMVFNLYKLMDALLCSKGWKLRSPYWEGEIGSRVFGYLSDRRWYSYRDKHHEFRVDLNLTTPQSKTGDGEVVLFEEVSDPFNLYNRFVGPGLPRPFEYLYPPAGPDADLRIIITNLKITLPPPALPNDPPGTFTIAIYRNRPPQLDFLWEEQIAGSKVQTVTHLLNYDIILEDLKAGDSFGVVMGYGDAFNQGSGNNYPYTIESADSLVFSPDVFYYVNDDEIYLADLLTDTVNGYQLFKEMARVIGAKIVTDYQSRTVWQYPAFDVSQSGVKIEGFFKRNSGVKDISEMVVSGSRIVRNKESERARFLELKFKDSTDAYIDSLGLKREAHSRLIDFGKGSATTTKIEMELFEPTVEVPTTVQETGDGIDPDRFTPYLPAIMDNLAGKISFDLGFRLLYCYGIVNQLDPDGNSYQLSFEGNVRNTFGYVSQVPIRPRSDGTGNPKTIPLAFAEFQEDLYRLYYKRYLQEQYAALDFEFLLFIHYDNYEAFNFRETVGFFYQDAFLIYQMTGIKDFSLVDEISTPVEFKLIEC